MTPNPLANINPADMQEFRNHQSLSPDQQGANLQRLLGNGFSFNKLMALKSQADQAEKAKQAQMIIGQAQQAGGAPPPMGQNSTVADDLQAQIRAALYPQQQQQMPQQMAQGQMPPQEQMPPQQMAQAQMPTQQMAHGGLAQLPVTNFRDENYAGGGIVAFNGKKNEQLVEEPDAYAEAMRKNPLSQLLGGGASRPDTESTTGMFLGAVGNTLSDLTGTSEQKAATAKLQDKRLGLQQAISASTPGLLEQLTPEERARKTQAVDYYTNELKNIGQPETPSVSTPTPGATPAKADSGIKLVTPEAKAAERARRSDIGTGRDKAGAEESLLSPEMQEAQKFALSALQKRKDIPEKSLSDIEKEQKDLRSRIFKERGISEKGHEEHIKELKDQAITARADRDTDRLMGIAQGFFTMAGGTSPYALKNMADGFGVTTKVVLESEKEYRKGEVARKASIGALNQAQRAEAIGDTEKMYQAKEKHDALREKAAEHDQTSAGLLLGRIGTAESTARTAREGTKSREAIARQTQALVGEQRDARLAETVRRNEEAERQKFAAFQQRMQEKHPLMVKGTLPNALTELEASRARLATKPTNPDFIKQFNFAQSQVDTMKDQVANESARDASRMMGAASGFKYVGVQ
jgi:hypothetical protein